MSGNRGTTNLRPFAVAVIAFAVVFGGGCGDNNSGNFAARVTATSFSGFPMAPGGAPPTLFLDEVLLVTLSGAVDNAIFGGFVPNPGTSDPMVFSGRIGPAGDVVLYHAYAQQGVASQAFQVIDDATAVPFAGIVGRSVTDPRVLVFDPRVLPGNPFGFTPTLGFGVNRQYDIFIPEDSGLNVNGRSITSFGAPPPVMPPPFDPAPGPSTVFVSGVSVIPDNTAPNVIRITTQSLDATGAPSSTPVPHDDVYLVEFTEPMDMTGANPISNVIVRNLSVTTAEQPQGVIVPTARAFSQTQTMLFISPLPSVGPGPFDIEITIGNADPARSLRDLAGNELGAVVSRVFSTIAAPGQPMPSSILETFATTDNRDPAAIPRYNDAEWDSTGPEVLQAFAIDGAPDSMNLGTGPGARTQVVVTPNGVGSPPVTAFFSPFDDNQNNNFGPGVNPQGGSHLQLLYNVGGASADLPMTLADSLELYEWRPSILGPNAATYDGFNMRMGHTSSSGEFAATPDQLTVLYDRNFTFDNPQNEFLMPTAHPDPTNPNANEAPVIVVPPQPYVTPSMPAAFAPFPLPSLPFDFDVNRNEMNIVGALTTPNLLIDIGIDAGSLPSNNFWQGANPVSPLPARRLAGAPGSLVAFTVDSVVSHARFTFVKKNSSARTHFLDSGSATTTWTGIDLFPDVSTRPAGSAITVRVQGADTGGVVPVGATPLMTYVSRNGVVDQSVLTALAGKRFIRLQFELEASTADNARPFIDDLLIGLVP